MTLDSLLGMVVAAARGVPEAVALQALLRAADDFFSRTALWTYRGEQEISEGDLVDMPGGEVWAPLSVPEGVRVVRLIQVGREHSRSRLASIPGSVRLAWEGGVIGVRGPRMLLSSPLRWTAVVAPVGVDTEIPDGLLSAWGHVIQAGATALLASGFGGALAQNPELFDSANSAWSAGLAEALNLALSERAPDGRPDYAPPEVYI